MKHRLNRADEAGLSRTYWAQNENLSSGNHLTAGSVGAHNLHQVFLMPNKEGELL